MCIDASDSDMDAKVPIIHPHKAKDSLFWTKKLVLQAILNIISTETHVFNQKNCEKLPKPFHTVISWNPIYDVLLLPLIKAEVSWYLIR